MAEELQQCPRRDEGFVYRRGDGGPDHWYMGRWAATLEEAEKKAADLAARGVGSHAPSFVWPGNKTQPRICSYCGGIHPEDAIALIEEGWLVGGTDKAYKRYLEPPNGKSLVPPVKLYVQHFTQGQVDRFNLALRSRASG